MALPEPPIGRVAFRGVGFGYPSRPEQRVIDNLDLIIEPGETVALVGPTGAGKTSVVSLLMRFYDVLQGRITVDGHDIRQILDALDLVAKQYGEQIARATARQMEYPYPESDRRRIDL